MHWIISWLFIATCRNYRELLLLRVVTCYYDRIVIISPSVSDSLSVLYNGGIPLQSCRLSIGNMQVSLLDLLMECL